MTTFRHVFSGGDGIIYAIDTGGRILYYRDEARNGNGVWAFGGVGKQIGPANGVSMDIDLEDGHNYEIVAVDPGDFNCNGQDDPMVVACRRDVIPATGLHTGDVMTVSVS